jgi:hypothetical protein
MEGRRTDSFANTALPINEQLLGAQILLDKCGLSLVSCPKDTRRYTTLVKRQARLLREISFLRGEIEAQNKLVAIVNEAEKQVVIAEEANIPL